MKYEIVAKSEISHGYRSDELIECYRIRRKYWLFNSYYHTSNEIDGPLFMMSRMFGGMITIGALVSLFMNYTYIISPLIILTTFFIVKWTEKYTSRKFHNLQDCENSMDYLIKIGSSNNKVIKKIDIRKDTIIIDKI